MKLIHLKICCSKQVEGPLAGWWVEIDMNPLKIEIKRKKNTQRIGVEESILLCTFLFPPFFFFLNHAKSPKSYAALLVVLVISADSRQYKSTLR
jgi:hypothetical protein